MKRCWLHIGMHKTGSSSIQANLAHDTIPGWCFLTVGRKKNIGQYLYAMLATEPADFHTFVKQGWTPRQVAREGERLRGKLEKAIRQSRAENLILSAETLSIVGRPGIGKLGEFLRPLCDEVRVIGYVRPPIGFKTSHFQQRIKHGVGSFDIGEIRTRYRNRFRKFDKVFGRANVILRKFDPATFPERCVVRDFHHQLGMPEPAPDSVSRSNESLSREACGILYAYRKFGPGFGVGPGVIAENVRLIAPLFSMGGEKFRVSRKVLDAGLILDAEDIAWMERRLGDPLDEETRNEESEITCEEDLLRITRASCEEYAARFQELHGIRIPHEQLPTDEIVDPRQVAAFVEYCRSRVRGRFRLAVLQGILGRFRGGTMPPVT